MVPKKPDKLMSKDRILNSIPKNRGAFTGLPRATIRQKRDGIELLKEFIAKAESTGSEVELIESGQQLDKWIEDQKEAGTLVIDLSHASAKLDPGSPVQDLSYGPGIVVIRGQTGVAENGAVWMDAEDMHARRLPFLASHLVLVLEKKNILADMHDAYDKIDLRRSGFGVFIAGPSKTADIEQSLVIGAHGPVRHTIFLY
jgi:L-lactate dehydrogenase complex protein LldG